jgi:DNA-binding transcriptional MerR regulator
MAAEPDTLPSNLTIGAVCRMLGEEFDDISISKIRFLEDQKLIAPRRTQGGYRLFSMDDVERLRAILRMQRDEFLPLAVIRDMLTQGVSRPTGTRRRRARALAQADRQLTLEDLVGETDADLRFIQELEEYGLLEGRRTGLPKPYTRTDVEIVALCQRLARYGVAARHLKAFRSAGPRGRPAGADPGAVAAILEPRPARGRPRGAGGAGRADQRPHAPAAGA